MKVQCQCGAKYAIDVTPEMAANPVRFVCPGCGLDLSGPINELVRQELGVTTPDTVPTAALLTATPAAAARIRVSTTSVPTPATSQPAAPAKLSLSRSASAATHGKAVEDAPQPGSGPSDSKPCSKHPGEMTVEHCFVCRKPLCPKCMEMFGYVCSPLCRAKATANGIDVPEFAGQKSVVEAREWKKMATIGAGAGAALLLILGIWFWYAWFGSVPHPILSVRFPERAFAGSSRLCGKNEIVFLHGGLLARYKMGSKNPIWSTEIITKQQVDEEVDRQMGQYTASLNEAIKHGSDYRPHMPLREELVQDVQAGMEHSLQLFVQDQNIWVSRDGKLTRYDWESGKPGQQLALPESFERPRADGSDLVFSEENAFGQHVITHVNLASGETNSQTIGEPKTANVLASTKPAKPTARKPAGASGGGAGLPKTPGADSDKPLDPAKVAQDAQNMPYAARVALPATLSSARHQEQIENEIKDDEALGNGHPEVSHAFAEMMGLGDRSFINGKYGYVQWSSKELEHKVISVKAMKDKPAHSALDNVSVNDTTAVANEILNEMQRDRGGDSVTEDQSRYQVTVHRPDDKEIPDWVGEVIGPPSVYSLKTVTVVAGGKMFVVLDKSNKKLWQSDLTYQIGNDNGFENDDPNQSSLGQGPCVERDDGLYVFDKATVTAYDLATGNVRWRVPTIGVVGLFFDNKGTMYVNSTTADLDSLKFSRQIDISKKTTASVLHVDCKTGKVLWNVQPGGAVSYVDGKFVFCFASHQAPDLDPDSLTTLPGMMNSVMDIRRLDPKSGKVVWDYVEQRAPLSVRFKNNIIELVFRKEVEVLKFLTL